ncbi:MAG: hypothetical protein V4472_23785 [Pseudomonadota bacterium]
MRYKMTPEDEATKAALGQALALVLIPGMIFVFALIYCVSPPYSPPSPAWANGIYRNPCCAPLVLRDGLISTGADSAHYTVAAGKRGFHIRVDRGIGVSRGAVTFGGTFQFVFFNRNSEAMPAIREAYSLHLIGTDDMNDYAFTKRGASCAARC